MVSNDFEHGFGSYSFMPGLNGSAHFEVTKEVTGNSYMRWNARKLGLTFPDWDDIFYDED